MLLEHCVISMSISTNCTLISMVYLQVVFLLHIGLWIILQSSLELVMVLEFVLELVLEMVWEALQCWLESATMGSGEGLLIFTFDKIDAKPERIVCEVCFHYKPFSL